MVKAGRKVMAKEASTNPTYELHEKLHVTTTATAMIIVAIDANATVNPRIPLLSLFIEISRMLRDPARE